MDLKCTNVCLFVSIAGLVSDLPPGKTVLERKPGRGERVVLPFAHSPSSKEKPVQAQGDPVAALLSPSPPQPELSVGTLFPGTGRFQGPAMPKFALVKQDFLFCLEASPWASPWEDLCPSPSDS